MQDPHRIESLDQLRQIVGETTPGVELKITDTLTDFAVDFIAKSPFLILATSDSEGRLDSSPKGDEPGFVHVLDDRTLVVPDRPGNRRLDTGAPPHLPSQWQPVLPSPTLSCLLVPV